MGSQQQSSLSKEISEQIDLSAPNKAIEGLAKERSALVKDVWVQNELCVAKVIEMGGVESRLMDFGAKKGGQSPFSKRLLQYKLGSSQIIQISERCTPLPDFVQFSPRLFHKVDFLKHLILSACSALRILHLNGFYHGDLSPEHLVLDSNRSVKLVGLTSVRSVEEPKKPREGHNAIYDAPEVKKAIETDPRQSDIFSLGLLFCELIYGRPDPNLTKLECKGRLNTINAILASMVHSNPLRRPSAAQILFNPQLNRERKPFF